MSRKLYGLLTSIAVVLAIITSFVLIANDRKQQEEYIVQVPEQTTSKSTSVKFSNLNIEKNKNYETSLDDGYNGSYIPAIEYEHFQTCKVIQVTTGDQFLCINPDHDMRYRISLFGIAAPLIDQPYGNQAKVNLSNLILNQTIHFDQMFVDEYENYVSVVYLNENNINIYSLLIGNAHVDSRYNLLPDYINAETLATDHALGLWNKHFWTQGRPPQKPWEYRIAYH